MCNKLGNYGVGCRGVLLARIITHFWLNAIVICFLTFFNYLQHVATRNNVLKIAFHTLINYFSFCSALLHLNNFM